MRYKIKNLYGKLRELLPLVSEEEYNEGYYEEYDEAPEQEENAVNSKTNSRAKSFRKIIKDSANKVKGKVIHKQATTEIPEQKVTTKQDGEIQL